MTTFKYPFKRVRSILLSRDGLIAIRDISIISLIAIPAFLHNGVAGMIRPSDSDFPINPADYLTNLSFTWNAKGWLFGNSAAFSSLAQRPFYFLPAVFQTLGLSPDTINLTTLSALFALVGVSGYIFGRMILPLRYSIASVVTGSFYMYNPYMMGEIYLGHWFSFYAYAAFPLVLLGVIRGLDRGVRCKCRRAL